MIKNRIVIIDGNSLINRAFYALPPLTTKEGKHTNAIYGFTTMLMKVLDEFQPEYVGVAFDKKAPTFRHKEYGDYKLGRKKMPQELSEQMEPLKELLDAFNIYRIEIEGYEADDLIGTLARHCQQNEIESLIVTGDKDALQLVSDKTKVLITKKGISNLEIYDEKKIFEDFEVAPLQIIDIKGLMGDASDNIPGVPGVGEKTAIKLIKQFGSIEEMIQNTQEIAAVKLRDKIEEYIDQAVLSKRLASIVTDVPVEIDLEHLKKKDLDFNKVIELFKKYEFNSLISKMSTLAAEEKIEEEEMIFTVIHSIKDLEVMIGQIKKEKEMVIMTVTEGKNIITDEIIALAIAVSSEQYYIDRRSFKEKDILYLKLKEVLEDPSIKKIGHDIKKEITHFYVYNVNIKNVSFDTMIGEYLINPSKTAYGLKELAAQYLSMNIMDAEILQGKGKNKIDMASIAQNLLGKYLCQRVEVVLLLKDIIESKIKELELENLFYKVEMPLVEVLASMEHEGIKVDRHKLEQMEIECKKKIEELTEEIYLLAGAEFNINSPKQLGDILFDKLKLHPIKKMKTGYSTSADVLEKLKDSHEIISKILEFRQVAKLKTTYIDGLLNIINPVTKRIHSSFNQTVTTTGRISSTEPNLQNIPVKLEMGRQIRKVFVADDNYRLIDADYSQIELRVLAHISQDNNLLEAFQNDLDIHTKTASEIFEVPLGEVTSFMRNSAKAVNFGIVYGISDFGLSENLNITRNKAKKYIDSYLEKYNKVREYMEQVVMQAKEAGYVVTLLNRRRYIPELLSKNFNIRSFGERMAMNTPIQGTAADIIKIAMVKVFNELREKNYTARLILQVHDELIVEAPMNEAEEVKEIVKESMEKAMNLSIPLKVDIAYGENWYDTK
jgi:DNA polymerase I